jgi:ferredoxin
MRQVLEVDIIACDGRRICADLFPERIRLDDWGYPIIDPTPIDAELIGHARRAVSNCPTLALRLVPVTLRPRPAPPR